MLKVCGLTAGTQDKKILNGVDLVIADGATHAIMGPNGGGKSTLAQIIAGNPGFTIEGGSIELDGNNIVDLKPFERAKLGVFLAFQYPLEIPGVNITSFLRMIYNKRFGQNLSPVKFRELLSEKMKIIDMKPEFMERGLNEGFSGGEKKRAEILQMLVLEPKLTILDEVDSGLDIDALKSVLKGVEYLRRKNPETAFIVITHYANVLDQIKPDFVHVMQDGRIVRSGGMEIARQLEQSGFKDMGNGC